MNPESPSSICPRCGAGRIASAVQGLCPKCLLAQAALQTEVEANAAISGTLVWRALLRFFLNWRCSSSSDAVEWAWFRRLDKSR